MTWVFNFLPRFCDGYKTELCYINISSNRDVLVTIYVFSNVDHNTCQQNV
jgi:hypothetical protein